VDNEKANRIKKAEAKFLKDSDNIIKLQNFNKKVYAVGMYDDMMDDIEESKEERKDDYKEKIIENTTKIRNLI